MTETKKALAGPSHKARAQWFKWLRSPGQNQIHITAEGMVNFRALTPKATRAKDIENYERHTTYQRPIKPPTKHGRP